MRKVLASQPDGSVRVVTVGFSTNLAGLLGAPASAEGDGIEMSGVELVRAKVEFLSIMGGHGSRPGPFTDFNVTNNVPAFLKVMDEWPTPVFLSGMEIGPQVLSRWDHLKTVLRPENPIRAAYEVYFRESVKVERWDRPSWDQTSMLQAIEPDANHFELSEPMRIETGPGGAPKAAADSDPSSPPRRFLRFSDRNPPETIEDILEAWYREPS